MQPQTSIAMTTTTHHLTSTSPSLITLVNNTLDLLNRIDAFIPAHTICLNGEPISKIDESSLRIFILENTYVPKISFMVHSEYINSKLVFNSLKRALYNFRENLQYDPAFDQIGIIVPYEKIDDLDAVWNTWLVYLAETKWQQVQAAT